MGLNDLLRDRSFLQCTFEMFHGRPDSTSVLIEEKFTGGWREIGMTLQAQSMACVNGQQVREWTCRGVAVGAPPPWAGAGVSGG